MAGVIKSSQSARSIQQVAYNLDDLTTQANGYLEKVRIQAAQIVVEAQKQADLIKNRARDEGQTPRVPQPNKCWTTKSASRCKRCCRLYNRSSPNCTTPSKPGCVSGNAGPLSWRPAWRRKFCVANCRTIRRCPSN
ncbi:MAG: hypothetical protein QM811_10660 [Pirellulales bacterium]